MHDRVTGRERDPGDVLTPHVVIASRFTGPDSPTLGRDHRDWTSDGHQGAAGRLMGPATPGEVTTTALREIGQRVRAGNVRELAETSPLLPRVDVQEDRDGRDEAIEQVLPWLRMLFAQPRQRLRVTAEVTHVARSRRVTPRSVVHLAGHSELWGRKTVRGVEPLRLLSERPEDELDIYENRVVRSALSESCAHLDRRLQAVGDVDDYLQQLEAVIDRLQQRPWRVTHRLSLLLEEAIPDLADREAVSERRKALADLRGKLGALQDDPFCRAVRLLPGSSSEVRWTNLLSDDARYRRAAELLLSLRRESAGQDAMDGDPVAPLLADMTAYCALLLIRALHGAEWLPQTDWQPQAGTAGGFQRGQERASVTWTPDHELVLGIRDRHVRVVPIVQPLRQVRDIVALQSLLDDIRNAISEAAPGTGPGTVVLLYPGDGSVPPQWPRTLQIRMASLPGEALEPDTLGVLPVGPLEADSSERIQRLVNSLTYGAAWQKHYPPRLSAPAALLQAAVAVTAGAMVADGDGALLLRPLTAGETSAVHSVLQRAEARDLAQRQVHTQSAELVRQQLLASAAQLATLLQCPACDSDGDVRDFHPRERETFWMSCRSCSTAWGLRPCSRCPANFGVWHAAGVQPPAERPPGWLDDTYGAEMLAMPCWADPQGPSVCPACASCPAAGRQPCVRCDREGSH